MISNVQKVTRSFKYSGALRARCDLLIWDPVVECPAPGEGSLVTSLACSTSAVEGTRFCSAGMAESGRSPSSSSFPLPGTSCRFERWSTYLRFAPRPPPSLFTLYESGPVLLLMCAFFHLGPAVKFLTRTCPLCKLPLFPCVVMLHLLWQLLGFHALSDVRSNEIQSRSQASVEQQLCWCNSGCCLGC